jgi:hypothetical protein
MASTPASSNGCARSSRVTTSMRASGVGVAYAQEQRHEAERDVAEARGSSEHETMTARAHGVAQRAVECACRARDRTARA